MDVTVTCKVAEEIENKDEILTLFLDYLTETLGKCRNTDLSSNESEILLATQFAIQSAPNIRKKLEKQVLRFQTSVKLLLNLTFGVFNHRDKIEVAQNGPGEMIAGTEKPD